MRLRLSYLPTLPGFVPLILLCGVLTVGWIVTPNSQSQAASAPAGVNADALDNMVAKLKAQQDTMAANQTKIEAQTALLTQQLNEAKIFASRSGGHR